MDMIKGKIFCAGQQVPYFDQYKNFRVAKITSFAIKWGTMHFYGIDVESGEQIIYPESYARIIMRMAGVKIKSYDTGVPYVIM
jgi:hypothetical protein